MDNQSAAVEFNCPPFSRAVAYCVAFELGARDGDCDSTAISINGAALARLVLFERTAGDVQINTNISIDGATKACAVAPERGVTDDKRTGSDVDGTAVLNTGVQRWMSRRRIYSQNLEETHEKFKSPLT